MPPLQRYVIALTGGLQDSRAQAEPSDLVQLYNFSLFRGRFALRAPVSEIATVGSESHILDIKAHLGDVWILTWNSSNQDVDLYEMTYPDPSTGWGTPTFKSQIHTSVTTKPTMFLTSFSGGTEDSPEDRLYIADYNQDFVTKYWNESGTSLSTVSEDWDADNSASNAYFSLMAPYQFHLWGTGHYNEPGVSKAKVRPEMLRFSQPGLIPNVDPAGGTPSSKEWFTFNHRSVGRRGDKIRALSYAKGNLIVFQAGSVHAVFGYGQDSWATKQLSDHLGCVGPRGATATDTNGMCYFWSHDGPAMTDGTTIQLIGEDIRQHVIEHQADERTSVAYSPDDGVVYFTLYENDIDVDAGDLSPGYYMAYDTTRGFWADGSWLKGANSPIYTSVLATATPRDIAKAPGPQGTPLSVSATAVSHDWITVSWDRGDLASDTKTEIYRHTSTGFTPGPTYLQRIMLNPQNTYWKDSPTWNPGDYPNARTTYYYKLRHWRNGEYSGESSEVNATTWCEPAEDVTAYPISTGIKVSFTVPFTGADILIERSIAPEYFTFKTLTTLTDQTAGTVTYDDTTTTYGSTYMYRVTVQDAGETDSHPVLIPFPVTATDVGTAPGLTIGDPSFGTGPGYIYVTLKVQWANCDPPSMYRVFVEEDWGSGYFDAATYQIPAVTSTISSDFNHKIRPPCPGSTQLKVRFTLQRKTITIVPGLPTPAWTWEAVSGQQYVKDDGGGYYNPCSYYTGD